MLSFKKHTSSFYGETIHNYEITFVSNYTGSTVDYGHMSH